ncbi:hypothetical protein P7C73_g4818, partial [Tremellales sp. Uapishka_1]
MSSRELVGEIVHSGIFAAYFILILVSLYFVFASVFAGTKSKDIFSGRPFLFLRTALGALLCTGYYLAKFMLVGTHDDLKINILIQSQSSYDDFAKTNRRAGVAGWLANTSLFEQAWSAVSIDKTSWWRSSFICTWTVLFSVLLSSESTRRGIRYPWAYMVLGQLLAVSVSTSLFLAAMFLHPPVSPAKKAPATIWLPLLLCLGTIYRTPLVVGTERFFSNLVWMHALLIYPFVQFGLPVRTDLSSWNRNFGIKGEIPYKYVYGVLGALSGVIHYQNTMALPTVSDLPSHIYKHAFSHPARTAISIDVFWVGLTLVAWFVVTGSTTLKIVKASIVLLAASSGIASFTGINWGLVASLVPMGILAGFGAFMYGISNLRSKNQTKRGQLLESLGLEDHGVIPGTEDRAPKMRVRKTIVGFWHPFCNAGGGGERVLWSAISYLQRTDPDVVILVYSGDYPLASKEEILGKVKNRFSIELDPKTMQFIPLPSRELISDTYWKHFTLLGQSFGSLVLAYEGLCGKSGLWGDVFLDSMGYAFTFPFVRFIAGSEIAIGAYIHYPTVSTDMVKRVRERADGIENGGVAKSAVRTWIKLVYYRIFTSLYSTSLLFSQHTMTNSSWTQAHIQSLLSAGKRSFVASVLTMDQTSIDKRIQRGEAVKANLPRCEVVYPPCDTDILVKLGNLGGRRREVVSLAQFRPEKEHAKQLHALSALFAKYPQDRDVRLTLMGGCRGPSDEERLKGLEALARDLGISDSVEFVANAPYEIIVERLGQASIGLNTMQDEHFGINIVEFMAAGLIPVVHSSAGPLLDIVVPFNGEKTGFHATDAESFAEALHAALSMSTTLQNRMRKAARAAAVERFSELEFDKGLGRGWKILRESRQ